MKELIRRWVSLFLSLLLFASSMPVYASELPVVTQTATVTFTPLEHGTITVDGESIGSKTVSVGETISYEIQAEDGYVIDSVTTSYADGTETRSEGGNAVYSNTVVVNQSATVTAAVKENADVQETVQESEQKTEQEAAQETAQKTESADEEIPQADDESSVWAYIDPSTSEISTYSLNNDGPYVITNERFDDFGGDLRMGIKYIYKDNENKDGHTINGNAMWRYVYCLQYHKDAPDGKSTFSYASAWTNKKIEYVYYWGAVYYYQTCRWSPYSSGNWKLDYFDTQWAIHVLNGEISLSTLTSKIQNSTGTAWQKSTAIDRITKMVNDANTASNYGGFDSDGWIVMNNDTCSFTLNGNTTGWNDGGDGYMYSNGTYSCGFTSYGGFDFREQISGYSVSAPGVEIYWKDSRTYADFQLRMSKATYASYQSTGKTIHLTVTLSIPERWGVAIYNPPADNYQKVGMLNWSGKGGTSTFTQTRDIVIPQVGGKIKIQKRSGNTSLTNGNGEYSLQGAVFDIYSGNTVVDTLTTDASGNATSKTLNYGSYTIKERTASKGYNKAADVSVNHKSSTTTVTINEPPKTGTINVVKKAENNTYASYGTYSLAGAEYTVYNASGNSVGTIKTDANGKGSLSGLALGSYTVKETKAPAGYYLNTDVTNVSFNTNTTSATVNSTEKVAVMDAADILLLQKWDSDSGPTPQGAASLENAEYTVKYYDVVSDHDPDKDAKTPKTTWVFKTDANGEIKVDADHLVSGTLITENGKIVFPVGTYTIKESKAPKGYTLSSDVFVAKVAVSGATTAITGLPTGENRAKERVVRGEIQFSKTNEQNKAMANIPFKITSKTTGENHIIYSGNDGMIRTAVRKNDAVNTGKNGVWFGAGNATDTYGSLPYDTYLVEEQPCEENKGYILDSFEVTISQDGVVVKSDTVRNLPTLKNIVVTKKVKASDINFSNGNPIFTFQCTGTDYEGVKHTYHQMVEITKDDVTAEEYVSVSCTFKDLKMGDYVVTEEQSSRYRFESATAEGGTVANDKVTFNMTPANDTYTATFTNKKFEWQYFTDSDLVTNTITIAKGDK